MANSKALPMGTDDPEAWLLGLVLVVGLGVAIGLAVNAAQVAAIQFGVTGSIADENPARVTVERQTDAGFERVGLVEATGDGPVWSTTKPGTYRVAVATGDARCAVRTTVRDVDGDGALTVTNAPDNSDCPTAVTVDLVRTFPWMAGEQT